MGFHLALRQGVLKEVIKNRNKESVNCIDFLLSSGKHLIKGSPLNPGEQLHIGLWLTTLHLAFIPQVPGQGSRHFWFMHALFCIQSVLTVHSGLQAGGEPI